MSVCIHLPTDLEAALRRQIADLDLAAKEALLVDLYRREILTRYELATALALDRTAVDQLLNRHGVTEDLPSAAEVHREASQIEALLGTPGRGS